MSDNIKICLADGVIEEREPGSNLNTILVGPPGSGKTFSNITSNILCSDNCSMVIDDKKGRLHKQFGDYLRNKGYEVYTFDLIGFKGNFCYNMMDGLDSPEDIMRLVDILMPYDNHCGERFWTDAGRRIVSVLIEVGRAQYGNRFNLKYLLHLVNNMGIHNGDDEQDKIQIMIRKLRKKGYMIDVTNSYDGFRNAAEVTWRSFVITTQTAIRKFSSPKLFEITNSNTIDFQRLGRKKVALFIINSDTNAIFSPIVQVLYGDITRKLINAADVEYKAFGSKLPVHVKMIMDDFASGTRQEKFCSVLANCRSRNISYTLAVQSISQLRAIYGRDANTILDCVDYKVFFATTNADSAELMSEYARRPINEIYNMGYEDVLVVRRCKPVAMKKRFNTKGLPEYKEATSGCDRE